MVSFFLALACFGGDEPALEKPPPPARSDLPNIVLITLDTTRADRMGACGHEGAQTPVFDAFAAQHLAKHKRPKIVEVLDGDLPRNFLGKVLRRKLRNGESSPESATDAEHSSVTTVSTE